MMITSSAESWDVLGTFETSKLRAIRYKGGLTVVVLIDDPEFSVSSQKSLGNSSSESLIVNNMIMFQHSSELWEKSIIGNVVESLEAYAEYLGEGTLAEIMAEKISASVQNTQFIESAIERNVSPVDLWCVVASTNSRSIAKLSNDDVERVIVSRKPLIEYDKSVLDIWSPFYYLFPVFPNSFRSIDTDQIKKISSFKMVAKVVTVLSGQSKNLKEAGRNLDITVTLDRELSVFEKLAIVMILKKKHPKNVLDEMKKMSSEQLVSYFSRVVIFSNYYDKTSEFTDDEIKLNDFLLQRVLDGVELVNLEEIKHNDGRLGIHCLDGFEIPDVYCTLIPSDAELFLELVKFGSDAVVHSFYSSSMMYWRFIKNPKAFVDFVRNYDTTESIYFSTLKSNLTKMKKYYVEYDDDLISHIISGHFNVLEIFDEYIEGVNPEIPFEMLLNMKLNVH